MPKFDYTVDDDAQSTEEHTLTPNQILRNAGIDESSHYLIQIKGQMQESYKDEPEKIIHMHQHMRFVSVYNGPTPVS